MQAIQGAAGNQKGIDAATKWEMYPGRAGGSRTVAAPDEKPDTDQLPTLDKISSMFGGPFDPSMLTPIEEIQRMADQIREANGWSSTPASSGL
jgi:hypothetical protein